MEHDGYNTDSRYYNGDIGLYPRHAGISCATHWTTSGSEIHSGLDSQTTLWEKGVACYAGHTRIFNKPVRVLACCSRSMGDHKMVVGREEKITYVTHEVFSLHHSRGSCNHTDDHFIVSDRERLGGNNKSSVYLRHIRENRRTNRVRHIFKFLELA